MERKFYTDNFEKYLKDNADEYRMVPSKKVWHGLYNDLHPGRRWPSAAMSILFIFTLVIIGHLNTGTDLRKRIAESTPAEVSTAKITPNTIKQVNRANQTRVEKVTSMVTAQSDYQSSDPVSSATTTTNSSDVGSSNSDVVKANTDLARANTEVAKTTGDEQRSGDLAANNSSAKQNDIRRSATTLKVNGSKTYVELATPDSEEPGEENSSSVSDAKQTDARKADVTSKKEATKTKEQTEEEKQLLISEALKQKIRENISYSFYITPSLSYRNFRSEVPGSSPALNGPSMSANRDMMSAVDQVPYVGLELGSTVNYKLNSKLKVKAGLQFNYSAYSIRANNTHPTLATLVLYSPDTGPYTLSTVSLYGNKTGVSKETLRNYNITVSTPVGFEFILGGNDNLQFGLAATFQPSFVIKDKSYVLSTNKLNYISDKSLLRNWNMATNAGAFVNFQTNGINWQIGPQIQYQLKSTYTSNYQNQEHLINYGIRLGVTKLLQ